MDKKKFYSNKTTKLSFLFILLLLIISLVFSNTTYASLSDEYTYHVSCSRSNRDSDTYIFQFEVYHYINDGWDKVSDFLAKRDIKKSDVDDDEKVWDQCAKYGATNVDPHVKEKFNATEAQSSIDSIIAFGGWTVIGDSTGSSGTTIDYPQYFIDCRAQGYDRTTSPETFDIWVWIRKKADENASLSVVFTAVINNVEGKPRSSAQECAEHGITANMADPYSEQDVQGLVNSIKGNDEWDITKDLTSASAKDPNKYYVKCVYLPNQGGIEVEATSVELYQGDLGTNSYNYIYGGDFNPNKTVGYRDCKNWLGVGETYNRSSEAETAPLEEITKEKYDEIYSKIEEAKELDRQYAEMYANGSLNSNASVDSDPCYTNSESIGWVLCPILKKVSEALDGLYTNALHQIVRTAQKGATKGR